MEIKGDSEHTTFSLYHLAMESQQGLLLLSEKHERGDRAFRRVVPVDSAEEING